MPETTSTLIEQLRIRDAAIAKARAKAERWIRESPDTDWARAGANILDALGEDVEARADGAAPSGLGAAPVPDNELDVIARAIYIEQMVVGAGFDRVVAEHLWDHDIDDTIRDLWRPVAEAARRAVQGEVN